MSARRSSARALASLATLAVLALLASCSLAVQDDADSGKGPSTSGGTIAAGPDFSSAPVRGITDDTIKLGAAVIDTQKLRDDYGIDVAVTPRGTLDALVTAQNERGGIDGRQIELVERNFLPVGNEESQTACRELIEDEKVFAVMGTYLDDNALCVTETHQTPYFSFFGLTAARQARSKAPFLTTAASVDEELQADMDLLLSSGELDDAKVAVYWESDLEADWVDEHVIDRLSDGGVDVVSKAQLPSSDDQVQADADVTRILQRFEADGADTLIDLSGVPVLLPALAKQTYRPRLVFTNGQVMGEHVLANNKIPDPESFAGSLAVLANNTSSEMAADPRFGDCLDDIDAHTDLHLVTDDIYSKTIKPDSREYGQLPSICSLWYFTLDVLRAAGDHPSAQSILDGLDHVELTFPLATGAKVSRTRWGAGPPPRLWHYDVDTDAFVPVGKPGG